jgi:hypothetical protein
MPDLLTAVLALALGLLVGLGAGVAYGLRLAARRRAGLGAHAQLARLWPAELPTRSASDILAGVIRVSLGGRVFELPVLPRAASRAWLENLDSRFADLAIDLEAAGNDAPVIMARLVAEADALYDMLLSYDQAGVLPPRAEIDAVATDTEILRGVLEVWRAVNPLAATVAETTEPPERGSPTPSPRPPTMPPTPTAGTPDTSSASSPTSSSSSTSTPARTASSERARRNTNGSSKRSASARCSPTTTGNTPAGSRAALRSRSVDLASPALPSRRP